jgi:hypothetical protein
VQQQHMCMMPATVPTECSCDCENRCQQRGDVTMRSKPSSAFMPAISSASVTCIPTRRLPHIYDRTV